LHIQCPGHRVSSSFENGLTIYFPEFHTQAIVGTTDIYLDTVPCYEVMSTSVDLQEIDTTPVSSTCNHITQFQMDIDIESSKIDQLLLSLRRYYNDVKTKRQLNLEVPAGFRRQTQWQTDAAYHDSLKHSTIQHCSDNVPDVSSITDLPSNILESTLPDFDPNNDVFQTPVSGHIPIVRSVDKPSTSLPNTITMNEDFLRASLGLRRIDTLKQHLPVLYQNNIRLDHTPADRFWTTVI
jgi:hypothetical protein